MTDSVSNARSLDYALGIKIRRHGILFGGRVLLLAVVLAVWEWLAVSNVIPSAFIGLPSKFILLAAEQWMNGTFPKDTVDTVSATLLAFGIGGIAALGTALILTALPYVGDLVSPYLTALNSLPRVALIPLFIIWFGLGTTSKVASGISLMYFILLQNTMAGAQSVNSDHLQLSRVLGLRGTRVFLTITVPTAVPAIFAGLRLGLVYTLLGVVTAELIAGGQGLGSRISFYSNTFNADGIFAVLLILVLVSAVLSGLMTLTERRLTRWRR